MSNTNLRPIAHITEDERTGRGYLVAPDWSKHGVDRPRTYSLWVPTRRLAERTARAMELGLFYSSAEVRTDINGQTYVDTKAAVYVRQLRLDLDRVGA